MSTVFNAEGVVVAVGFSPEHAFPTYPQERIYVGLEGIPGDAHSGPWRESFTQPGTQKPNDRPISIVSNEVRLEMNERFGIDMQPGDFNEQILVGGVGDLGDVAIGTEIQFSTGLRLETVDWAWPCAKLAAYNRTNGLVKALDIKLGGEHYSRRGVLAKVLQAGELRPGETLKIAR